MGDTLLGLGLVLFGVMGMVVIWRKGKPTDPPPGTLSDMLLNRLPPSAWKWVNTVLGGIMILVGLGVILNLWE